MKLEKDSTACPFVDLIRVDERGGFIWGLEDMRASCALDARSCAFVMTSDELS